MFSVLIPAYNETETIGVVLSELLPLLPENSEVVVAAVDDHPTDPNRRVGGDECPTGQMVLSVGDRRAKTCHGGDGLIGGVLNAAENASFEMVVVMDGDGQHDPNIIGKMIETLQSGEVDVVVGATDPLHKKGWRKGLTWTAVALMKSRMPTRTRGLQFPQSGFFATHRQCLVEALRAVRPFGYKALYALLMHRKMRTVEIPTVLRRRVGGASRIRLKVITSDARLLLKKTLTNSCRLFDESGHGATIDRRQTTQPTGTASQTNT